MLLRFSVENWMSFRDEATLDLVATREEQHSEHIAAIEKYDLRLLPVAAIYGANASGKSNLIKALAFAQKFITDPPKPEAPIPVRPFLLSRESSDQPTGFRIEALIDQTVFEYRFSVTSKRVVHEELKRINKTTEDVLFRRGRDTEDFTISEKVEESDRQIFAYRGTNDNKLFLTNSVSQKLVAFEPVFEWFKNKIVVILPETRVMTLASINNEDHPLFDKMIGRLRSLDSGIASLRQVEVSPDSLLPKQILDSFSASLKEGQSLPFGPFWETGGFSLRKEKGSIIARRLASIHQNELGEEVPFSFADESDGTRRLFDLLPAFLQLEASFPGVFVIDELDRSLHSLLTRQLLDSYLAQPRNSSSRSQLVFTTHDTQLMTQDIFRRDEIWITERDQFGASKLIAFSEFKDVRKDKDIRKSYLQGRLGGVPRIKTTSPVCEDEAPVV
jgi:AAA15 family ATPase/GTPase